MRGVLALASALVAFLGCQCLGAPSASSVRGAEQAAAARRETKTECRGRTVVYEGSIQVDARDYTHFVPRGDDQAEEPIAGLDRIVTPRKRLTFTLDYPFEKPFGGSVAGESGVTLRQIIDAIRAGFRKMYEGTSQRDIPGLVNKDVRGPYGKAFHVIGDLVIEGIRLCEADGTLEIDIGS